MTKGPSNILFYMDTEFNIDEFLKELNRDLADLYAAESDFVMDTSTRLLNDSGKETDCDS